MKKIAIIGAGVFGCSAAIELQKNGFEVHVFDRSNDILGGASNINHLRHHSGYHYPRSKEMVEEIKKSKENFESAYGESISKSFDNFYAISLNNSKTTPKDFISFCDEMKLPYDIAWPEDECIQKNKIGVCIKTPEKIYDPSILKGILYKKIRDNNIKLFLNHKLVSGKLVNSKKHLNFKICDQLDYTDKFDYVINATYSNFDNINKIFGFKTKNFKLQYELIELLEIHLPVKKKFGLTVMDGNFFSLMPRGEKNTFTLGHVEKSILKLIDSKKFDAFDISLQNKITKKDEIIKKSAELCPILSKSSVIQSLYITRVIKSDVKSTDERPSEITFHKNGIYSILGGKVITSVNIAKEITEMIKKESLEKK